jgi:hypothetical protein
MKSTFTRPAIVLALALGLAACGGKATFTVGGPISGLIDYGTSYSVSVKTNPAHQTCAPVGADPTGHAIDTAGRMASISVQISCGMNTFTIGGTASGLTANGLVLTNGSSGGTVTLDAGATAFTFPAVAYGVSYGVTVLTQPPSGTVTCSVSPNGTGVMGDAAVGDIVVTCVPKA